MKTVCTLLFFIINIVVNKLYTKQNDKLIISRLKNQISNEIEIKINHIKNIPLNNNGKFQAVISKLKND